MDTGIRYDAVTRPWARIAAFAADMRAVEVEAAVTDFQDKYAT